MEYRIMKVFNNNVVLAKEKRDEVILISKGIGFGRKSGDFIKDNTTIEKVFHEATSFLDGINLKIEELTHHIIEIAKKELGVLNEYSEKMLKEHIEFAIERLKMGLTIENPFIEEIKVLYHKEYEVAAIAREYIKAEIGIDIGEEEQGFIALHLCSARKNKAVTEIVKVTRIYKECLDIVEEELKPMVKLNHHFSQEFFKVLKFYVDKVYNQNNLKLDIKDEVQKTLKTSYKIASKMARHMEVQMNISFTEDVVAYMAIDIQKLIQLK